MDHDGSLMNYKKIDTELIPIYTSIPLLVCKNASQQWLYVDRWLTSNGHYTVICDFQVVVENGTKKKEQTVSVPD